MTAHDETIRKTLDLAVSHHKAGRFKEAEITYRQVLVAEPENEHANHFLGILAAQAGQPEMALQLISKAIEQNPSEPSYHLHLGNVYLAQNRLNDAVDAYDKTLTLRPGFAEALFNLGNVLRLLGRFKEATGYYQKAIASNPDYAGAHIGLGIIYRKQGQLVEAAAALKRALALQPDNAETLNNLAGVFTELGQIDEAIKALEKAIVLNPELAAAHNSLGILYFERGRLREAETALQRALAINRDYVEAYNNLGNILAARGRFSEAVMNFSKALGSDPNFAQAHNNLGNALKASARLNDALSSYRKAVALDLDYSEAHSNLLLAMNYLPACRQEEIFAESVRWWQQHGKGFFGHDRFYSNSRDKKRRLRIGYLSPDFRDHSVACFIEPVLKSHDRNSVEVFCYTNVSRPDTVTERIRAAADHWVSVVGRDAENIGARVRADNIDILVDLAGHTVKNSLLVFARKPAPIQVTWLGYPNTTGLAAMDYRLTDAVADPAGEGDELYSETLVRLEHGFLCYQAEGAAVPVTEPPCVKQGHITFGSFNNLAKTGPEVLRSWAKILNACKDSHLILKSVNLADEATADTLRQFLGQQGIAANRIHLLGQLESKNEHLEMYGKVDIALDPFPYNGTTTSCEALWMGVPVVTLQGERHSGRVGASILRHAGLEDLVADSIEGYIALAVSLADDREALREFRAQVRDLMQQSMLMDKKLFTATLEEAYRTMWLQWCDADPDPHAP